MILTPPYPTKKKVQVWLFAHNITTHALECLILKTNLLRGNFWQPITGSVESFDVSLFAAAQREMLEETGLSIPKQPQPIDYQFHFIDQYGTKIEEHGFYHLLSTVSHITIDPHEHDSYAWVPPAEALKSIAFESNQTMLKKALKLLQNP